MSKEKSKTKKEEKHKPKKEDDSKTKKENDNDSKTKKEDDPNDNDLDKFDRLVKRNKASKRPWYYGLEDKWWWGMTERDSRKHIESEQILKDRSDTITTSIVLKKAETIKKAEPSDPEIKIEETPDPEIKIEETPDPEIKIEETPDPEIKIEET